MASSALCSNGSQRDYAAGIRGLLEENSYNPFLFISGSGKEKFCMAALINIEAFCLVLLGGALLTG